MGRDQVTEGRIQWTEKEKERWGERKRQRERKTESDRE